MILPDGRSLNPVNEWALDILQRGATTNGGVLERWGADGIEGDTGNLKLSRLKSMVVGGYIESYFDVTQHAYRWFTTEFGRATIEITLKEQHSPHVKRALNLE